MSSNPDQEIVYLEDLEGPSSSQRSDVSAVSATSLSQDASKKNASKTVSAKRQITLLDMFAGNGGNSSGPSAKKQKLSPSNESTSSSGSKGLIGLQKLNSIPFSLKAFQDSLNEEQKNLLRLECQTMNRSW